MVIPIRIVTVMHSSACLPLAAAVFVVAGVDSKERVRWIYTSVLIYILSQSARPSSAAHDAYDSWPIYLQGTQWMRCGGGGFVFNDGGRCRTATQTRYQINFCQETDTLVRPTTVQTMTLILIIDVIMTCTTRINEYK